MSKEPDDNLSTQERQAFGRLTKEKMPPSLLEERIVEALKESDLIRSSGRSRPLSFRQIGLALAASTALFVLGDIVGARWVSGSSATPRLPEFMLVLRAPAQESQRSADEVRKIVEEYSAWAGEIRTAGSLVVGEKLKAEARLISRADGRTPVSHDLPIPRESQIQGTF